MISYQEACLSVGYDRMVEYPTQIIAYWAYKDGEAKSFDTLAEARKFSINIQHYVKNKDELDRFKKKQQDLESKAVNYWQKALRDEYSHISDNVFNLCYSKAYEDGHSSGYNEVANYMIDYVEFAENIFE